MKNFFTILAIALGMLLFQSCICEHDFMDMLFDDHPHHVHHHYHGHYHY